MIIPRYEFGRAMPSKENRPPLLNGILGRAFKPVVAVVSHPIVGTVPLADAESGISHDIPEIVPDVPIVSAEDLRRSAT